MPYVLVDSLKAGVDRTRPIYASAAGTAWSIINAHLSRGGDAEKRKAFIAKYGLPANATFGLKATATALYVFGSGATPSGIPSGVTYQRLQHPSAVDMSALLWAELFNGLIYAIAEYVDDSVHHFYNGSRVTDWDGGAGNPAVKGRTARTLQRKVYSAGSYQLSFSGVDTATGWTDPGDTGAGQINMSNHLAGSEDIISLAVYQAKIAAFSRNAIQIWLMFASAASNAQDQVLESIGTRAAKSVVGFHEHDVFFLADSGIRSLRTVDITGVAGIDDVGTAIDPLIAEYIATLTDAEVEAAVAVVEPKDGRLWMAIGARIFVFTYFSNRKISAWSWYEPGFTVEDFAVKAGRVYARADDTIYLYGGDDGDDYDASRVTVQLPFLTAGKPGHFKAWTGMDVAATGTWEASVLVDPNDEDVEENIGEFDGVTFDGEQASHWTHKTHIAPKLVNEEEGYASLSNLALYYQGADSPGGTA